MNKNCDSNTELFWSPFMEKFREADYLEEHPEVLAMLSSEDLDEAKSAESLLSDEKTKHNNLYELATATARNECASCPALDWCRNMVLNTEDPIYGIAAGMNERERRAYRKSGGTIVGRGEAAELLLNGVE